MKEGIHPNYIECAVSCACGNKFITHSTKPVIKLVICSKCHPFYTGQQKLVDAAGRVEKFQKRFEKTGGRMLKRAAVKRKAVKAYVKGNVLSSAPMKAKPKLASKETGVKKEKKAVTK